MTVMVKLWVSVPQVLLASTVTSAGSSVAGVHWMSPLLGSMLMPAGLWVSA